MIRLWLSLIFLVGVSFAAVWVADHPGDVVIRWGGWRVDTSLGLLVVLAIVVAWLFTFIYTLLRDLARAPHEIQARRQLTHYEQGLKELTYSVAALAASDINAADVHAKKAQRKLGTTPMGLLLSAQIAKSRGDDKNTAALLEQMLEHRETEYLAARLLSDAASKQKSLPRALTLAERAYAVNPKDGTSLAAIVSLKLKLGKTREAFASIRRGAWWNRATPELRDRWRGLAYMKQAQIDLDLAKPKAAVKEAGKALRTLKDFVPAQMLYARALDANKQTPRAVAYIERCWKKSRHPQLTAMLETYAGKLPPKKQLRLKNVLSAADVDYPTGMWHCRACGHSTSQWDMHCASCGAFDTQDWR